MDQFNCMIYSLKKPLKSVFLKNVLAKGVDPNIFGIGSTPFVKYVLKKQTLYVNGSNILSNLNADIS